MTAIGASGSWNWGLRRSAIGASDGCDWKPGIVMLRGKGDPCAEAGDRKVSAEGSEGELVLR